MSSRSLVRRAPRTRRPAARSSSRRASGAFTVTSGPRTGSHRASSILILAATGVATIMPQIPNRVNPSIVAKSTTNGCSPTFRPTSTPEPESGPEFLDRVVLAITVSQRTWTRIDVDGATVFEGPNKPGEVLRYAGQEEIRGRTGHGAALEVVYNGQDIGPLGERGEVVERFFTVSGQLTPTPTPTLTPTNTGVPTPTPRFTPTPEREQ